MTAAALAAEDRFSLSDISSCTRTELELAAARQDPFFKKALAVWDAKRGDRFAPFRRDIDALDFSSDVLPRLMLVEVVHEPLCFRFRLTGTKADQIHERNITGLLTDDLQPSILADAMRRDFTWIVNSGQPQWVELVLTDLKGSRRQTRILRLPLLADTAADEVPEIGYIMSVFIFKKLRND